MVIDDFHPETMKMPLREEIRLRYQQLYGYDVSDEQIDGILQIEMNKVANTTFL